MKAKHCELILYSEDGWTAEKITMEISGRKTIKLYAFILHDRDLDENGNTKKSHFHLYLNFGNSSTDFKYIARWFSTDENKVNRIKSNRQAVLLYMTHSTTPDKAPYAAAEIKANFDVAREIKLAESRNGNSERTILDGCADGTITPENYSDYVSSTKYIELEPQMKRAWTWYQNAELKRTNSRRECCVLWVCGPSGTGKTTLVSLLAEKLEQSLYITATGKDPFSDYSEQPIIALDDIRANVPFNFAEFLKVIDPHYASPLASRYHNKRPQAKIIAVCTVQTPQQFYDDYNLPENDSYLQLLRRLSFILKVSKESIAIYGDYDGNEHSLLATVANPVPAYLAQMAATTNDDNLDLLSIVSAINEKYHKTSDMPQQLTLDDILQQ